MKLNLLPATVSKGRQAKTAWAISIVVALVSIGASFAMIMTSSKELNEAQSAYDQAKIPAEAAVKRAADADAIMADANVRALVRNVALAQSMIEHNDKYPALYGSLLPYIPPFYRLTSMSAQPISDTQASVTLTGTIGSYQQYADLMLALMRNPNAVTVARSGFQSDAQYVPNLVEIDQTGRVRRPGENPIPDDMLERLAFFESQGAPAGYTGAGNFGTGTPNTKGAMPGQSLVTVQMVVNAPIQVPNPRASMAGGPPAQNAGGGGAVNATLPGPGTAGGNAGGGIANAPGPVAR